MHDRLQHRSDPIARIHRRPPHSLGVLRAHGCASPGGDLLEELLVFARRSALMTTENDTTHHAIPPPGLGLVTSSSTSEQSRTWQGRFTTRDPGPAAALLEDLAVGDAELARQLQELERRAIASMTEDLGSGALIEIQKAALAVRERLMVTLSKATEFQEKKNNYEK